MLLYCNLIRQVYLCRNMVDVLSYFCYFFKLWLKLYSFGLWMIWRHNVLFLYFWMLGLSFFTLKRQIWNLRHIILSGLYICYFFRCLYCCLPLSLLLISLIEILEIDWLTRLFFYLLTALYWYKWLKLYRCSLQTIFIQWLFFYFIFYSSFLVLLSRCSFLYLREIINIFRLNR
jgi:hypothetical protein